MKSRFGTAGLCIEFSSIPKGYLAMSFVDAQNGISILEGSPVSPGKFLLTLDGEERNLNDFLEQVRMACHPDILDCSLLNPLNENLFLGLYGLLKTPLSDLLIVSEALTTSSGLAFSNKTLNQFPIQLIEFRSPRGIGGKSIAYFTALKSAKEDLEKHFKFQGCTFEIIDDIRAPLRSYFDLNVSF